MGFHETISPDGLPVRAAHRRNPYEYLMNGQQLDELLTRLGQRRAASIWRNRTVAAERAPRDVYPRPCMAFVLMDPTAGPWVSNADAVLGVITVGEGGSTFLPYAAAKAAGHRRLGRNYGEAVLVDPHLCGDGNFRYGHSARVRGQIVGSSSQTPDQDLYEAAALATDLVNELAELHLAWEERTGPGEWFTGDGRPGAEYSAMVEWFPSSDNAAV
ncbi:hypothetical protein ACQEVG_26335 [Streptomyces sp. CA-135486]|uniref:hypothetical protein n=1 Tax=Streptomyces sp. CA-135486 TaxID=3240049 RepID=UPI003D93BF91